MQRSTDTAWSTALPGGAMPRTSNRSWLPSFSDNIILTKTERLMMSNRPPDPKNARNKNVLVVGGSGSGKTRFWLKPNLFTMSQFLCGY